MGCTAAQMGVHAHMGMSISAHPCEIFLTSSSTLSPAPLSSCLLDRQVIAIDTAGCFGRSNRARRAKDADQLFTRAAGVLRPAGAKLDAAGNAAGAEFDLGVAGAFTGLKVVVLQQYRDGAFDFSYPRAALEVRREGACSQRRHVECRQRGSVYVVVLGKTRVCWCARGPARL